MEVCSALPMRKDGEKVMKDKFCPLCDSDSMVPECLRESCAWWTNGRCAIVAIAENLKKLEKTQPKGE